MSITLLWPLSPIEQAREDSQGKDGNSDPKAAAVKVLQGYTSDYSAGIVQQKAVLIARIVHGFKCTGEYADQVYAAALDLAKQQDLHWSKDRS